MEEDLGGALGEDGRRWCCDGEGEDDADECMDKVFHFGSVFFFLFFLSFSSALPSFSKDQSTFPSSLSFDLRLLYRLCVQGKIFSKM